jgi:hypothetical protein
LRGVVTVVCVFMLGLAACGNGPSVQATSSPSSPPPSSVQPSPSPTQPTATQQLQLYFAAILPAFVSADRATKAWTKAQKVFDAHQQAVSAYPAFRRVVEKSVAADTSLEVALTAVTPPPSLVKAHKDLLKYYRQDYDLAVFIREALRLKVPYAMWFGGWQKRSLAEEKTYRRWEIAVRAEAMKLGLKIPARLRAVM